MILSLKELVEGYWASGQRFFVHLDSRKHGVQVPENLLGRPSVVLEWGAKLPIPITDFYVGEYGFGGVLTYKKLAFYTFVPFDAVFAVYDSSGKGRLISAALPEEVARTLVEEARAGETSGPHAKPLKNADGTLSLAVMRARKRRG